MSKEQVEIEIKRSTESALDRISMANNVDEQVEKEIRRYWNERVIHGGNKILLRRLRLNIVSLLERR